MHYYTFNIGDYHAHTHHLTDTEDLAYRRMLDWCYLNEKPLPLDLEEIAKKIRMRMHSDCIATVLKEFFVETEKGFFQKRIKNEIEKFKNKSKKAKKSAELRWNKEKVTESDTCSDANALQAHSERNANHKPITNNQEPINISMSESKIPTCPSEEIINIYHEILPELPKVVLSAFKHSVREKNLKARWKQDHEHQSLDFWRWYFQQVKKNTWYLGDNTNAWRADFGWLMQKSKFDQIVERGL